VVVDMLKALDIEFVALNPGSSYRWIHDSLVNYGGNTKPEVITVGNEGIAVAIAHGYAKAKGRPMAATLHDTVGLLWAGNGIFNAWCDRVPILLMVGNGPMDVTTGRPTWDWFHTAELPGHLVRDYVKWHHDPRTAASLPETFVRAYQVATTPPRGPVLLSFDVDLQRSVLDRPVEAPDPARYAAPRPPAVDGAGLERLAEWLLEATRAVVITEFVGRVPAAVQELRQLAELTGTAVVDLLGAMNFPSRHPLNFSAEPSSVVGEADLIVGFDVHDLYGSLAGYEPGVDIPYLTIRSDARVASVSYADGLLSSVIHDYERLPPVQLRLLGESADAIAAVRRLCERAIQNRPGLAGRLAERRAVLERRNAELRERQRQIVRDKWDLQPISTQRLVGELGELVRGADWFLTNGSYLEGLAGELWGFERADQFIGHSGGGGLGYGCGAAIGAALAVRDTERLCINIQADGDLLFTPAALWTAAHHRVPLLTVMFNNRSYFNSEAHALTVAKVRGGSALQARIGTVIEDPEVDFAQLARSMGMHGEGPVQKPNELKPALERALRVVREQRRPALVDVVTADR
jgi:thiamine pyrophosphate-dependent acetolactate synthase large subunit-like protein